MVETTQDPSGKIGQFSQIIGSKTGYTREELFQKVNAEINRLKRTASFDRKAGAVLTLAGAAGIIHLFATNPVMTIRSPYLMKGRFDFEKELSYLKSEAEVEAFWVKYERNLKISKWESIAATAFFVIGFALALDGPQESAKDSLTRILNTLVNGTTLRMSDAEIAQAKTVLAQALQ